MISVIQIIVRAGRLEYQTFLLKREAAALKESCVVYVRRKKRTEKAVLPTSRSGEFAGRDAIPRGCPGIQAAPWQQHPFT
jgi:hypothetical protein